MTTLLVTVWKGERPFGRGINEKCYLLVDGNYEGIESGTTYSKDGHYHSPVYAAIGLAPRPNETCMYYRDEVGHPELEGKYIEVEKAHYCGNILVWRLTIGGAYLSGNEIRLLSDEPVR